MVDDDLNYYRRREHQELALASRAEDNAVALAHFQLADAYAAKAGGLMPSRLALEQAAALDEDRRRGPTGSSTGIGFPLLRN